MPNDHAKNGLTASGSHRWLNCTPSAKLEQQFPNKTSSYAEEGTLAHEVAALTAQYWLGGITEASFENEIDVLRKNEYYNAEMQDHANAYAKFICKKFDEAKERCPDAFVLLERRLDFSRFVPEGFGTGDCIIVAEPTLEVIDYKYGKGVRVEAADNSQMQLYALGALEEHGWAYDITDIDMTIFQPRLNSIDSASIKATALLVWAENVVRPAAEKAATGEGEFCPSEEVCRFCRAKHQCKARATKNLELFDSVEDPVLLTPEEAGAILAKAGDIETWLADLKGFVQDSLILGEKVPGWKLVEGRTNRRIGDPKKAADAFVAAGYDEALLYERKMLSLTQLEKTFGKSAVAETIGAYITKPKGAPALAKASDRRKEYSSEGDIIAAFDEG